MKDDTISRKAAIDAIFGRSHEIIKMRIGNLPSAQPKSYREGYQAGYKDAQSKTAERTAETAQNVSDEDLISRKAAIEKIESHTRVGDELYPLTDTDKILNHAFEIAASCVYNLPSAQPKSYREGYQAGFKDAQSETAAQICEVNRNEMQ